MRRNSQASPIKEKRVKRFSPPDFLSRFRAMRRNPHASPIKEKRVSVFQLQTSYKIASSVRSGYIRVSRTTAFCIAKCAVVVQGNDTASLPCVAGIAVRIDKRKTAWPFFASRLPIRFRAVAVRGFPKTASLSACSERKFIIVSAKADCESVFGKFP